jgi:ribosome-associated protein
MIHIKKILPPAPELSFSFSRGGGPGGQNVNKVSSRVTLHWPVTESSLPSDLKLRFIARYGNRLNRDGVFILHSDSYRDQPRNRQDCLDRLSDMLQAVATPPKVRRPTKIKRSAKEKRLKAKKQTSRKKNWRQRVEAAD